MSMKLIEMDGFLRGKCIPRDLMVNETNAEYLVRKFAEADARCAAMAAELSAVDAIQNDAVFITDDHYEQCPPEVQKMIRSLAVLQIPACKAFLAEVRASAITDALKSLDGVFDTDCVMESNGISYEDAEQRTAGAYAVSKSLEDFAAQLRKGVQS